MTVKNNKLPILKLSLFFFYLTFLVSFLWPEVRFKDVFDKKNKPITFEKGGIPEAKGSAIVKKDSTSLFKLVTEFKIADEFIPQIVTKINNQQFKIVGFDNRAGKFVGYTIDIERKKVNEIVEPVYTDSIFKKEIAIDLNGDGKIDQVKTGGGMQGHDSGFLEVFLNGAKTPLSARRKWGNIKTSLLTADLNRDKLPEIIIADNQDSTIHIFQYDKKTRKIIETSNFKFHGYSGQGYTPVATVGDIDGDGQLEILAGLGGHCSHIMGSGLYTPFYGWIAYSDDPGGVTSVNVILDEKNPRSNLIVYTTADGFVRVIQKVNK